jgi:hypothetical protein
VITRAVVAETAVNVSGSVRVNVFVEGLLRDIPVLALLNAKDLSPVPCIAETFVMEPTTPWVTVAESDPELVDVNRSPWALKFSRTSSRVRALL